MTHVSAASERIIGTYRGQTKRSQELFEQAGHVLEGGMTRTSVFFSPYPSYVVEGSGCRFTDLDGKVHEEDASGLYATCIQHEIDHLNGVLFIDYLSRLKRDRVFKKFEKAAKRAAE